MIIKFSNSFNFLFSLKRRKKGKLSSKHNYYAHHGDQTHNKTESRVISSGTFVDNSQKEYFQLATKSHNTKNWGRELIIAVVAAIVGAVSANLIKIWL